jgi:glycosyltransferase involved in cell wall biosynthesis
MLVSDAWYPQVNGVVRTLDTVRGELENTGYQASVVSPDLFRTVPCPTYPEIRLAVNPGGRMRRALAEIEPQAIHIATEGPLGLAARNLCIRRGLPFTTSFHTRFPEYIQARTRLPAGLTYRGLRWFHNRAARVMVATDGLQRELEQRGFEHVVRWSRGVDTELFRPRPKSDQGIARPIFAYVGRVAVEKNVEAFLALDLPGTKLVVGDGPQLASLRSKYPQVRFTGALFGEELARTYAEADVFVFPSRTDTFGLVLLEALGCGVPVAAFPVLGPLDVVAGKPVGVLDEDLRSAALRALELDPRDCRAWAEQHSWRCCAETFAGWLEPIERSVPRYTGMRSGLVRSGWKRPPRSNER